MEIKHTPWLGGPTREAWFLSSFVVPSSHPFPLFLAPTYSPKLLSMPDSKAPPVNFGSLARHKEGQNPQDSLYGWDAWSFPILAAMA